MIRVELCLSSGFISRRKKHGEHKAHRVFLGLVYSNMTLIPWISKRILKTVFTLDKSLYKKILCVLRALCAYRFPSLARRLMRDNLDDFTPRRNFPFTGSD